MPISIKTENLRVSADRLDNIWAYYIPTIFPNGDYILPPRNSSILKGCTRFRKRSLTTNGRKKLFRRLQSIGIQGNSASILSSRSVSEIKRIESTVEGIIDSLLLFDLNIFIEDIKLIKYLIRSIFKVGTYGTGSISKYWKELTLFIFHSVSEMKTIKKPEITRGNFFFCITKLPKVTEMLAGKYDKKDLESLAHLMSTRHLPAGDKSALNKALESFKAVTTSKFEVLQSDLTWAYKAARKIGRQTRKTGNRSQDRAHISMSCAGSYYKTILEGGRAAEILDAITPLLTYVPLEDELIATPLGDLKCPKGIPRWRSWCRRSPIEVPEGVQFRDIKPDTLIGYQVYYYGLDEAIGLQIVYCAYLSYKDWIDTHEDIFSSGGIPSRVLSVPEPGYKTRIVTTPPWWCNILQQAPSHIMRGFLSTHPSAESGMMRTDQAWQYLYLISKASIPEGWYCLSSDLKEATDAIPKSVSMALLQGYKDGLGITSPLVDIAISLATSNRLFMPPQDIPYLGIRGIPMGEPMAKVVLTLLNLSVEEISIHKYLGMDITRPIAVPWRAYAVGGDDHIAVGPKKYLLGITQTHLSLGSVISETKHGMSKKLVTYCEKLLEVKNFHSFSGNPVEINYSTENYLKSPFVDSIKVRLLSPVTKSIDITNEKNTAIGKGKSLGRTLRWLNHDQFDSKWINMVRDRFFQRMGTFMPDRSSGTYWHLLLPEFLGGLGLYLEQDLLSLCHRLPSPTKSMIKEIARGEYLEDKLKLFKSFTSNSSYRGFKLLEREAEIAEQMVNDTLIPHLTAYSWKEAKDLIPGSGALSAKTISERLKAKQIYLREDLKDIVLRPFLFKEILSKEAIPDFYDTVPFKKRYAKLWDLTYNGECVITPEEIMAIFSYREHSLYYDAAAYSEPYLIDDVTGEIEYLTIPSVLQEVMEGMPTLAISYEDVGTL